jgi:dephospho-CoA kinase
MTGSAGPVLVGLTGGIGSGKSEALRAFHRHGAATLSSDESVRSLYGRGIVKRAVRDHFGSGVIGPDGAVDRAAVGRIVFADLAELRWLEGLLLPLLAEEFARWRDAQVREGARLLVHEAPTLFEAGVGDRYDVILTVTAPEATREQRRPGSRPQRENQLPEDEKAARSDFVYENTGSLEDLDRFVAGLAERLLA